MTAAPGRFDPWGPIFSVLVQIGDADFLLNAVEMTGIDFNWKPLSTQEAYSHGTRLRAYRLYIAAAYSGLSDDQKGRFAQIVVKAMLGRHNGDEIRQKLDAALADIGWHISAEGILCTDDAMIAEQFFQPNTQFDAYVAIRDVLGRARTKLTIVDGYLGTKLLSTLRALDHPVGQVRLITIARNLPADFATEAALFRAQFPQIDLAVRATADFHDRFIVIDDTEFYFVGASIKDAGRKAFMISQIQDQPNVEGARRAIEDAWIRGTALAV